MRCFSVKPFRGCHLFPAKTVVDVAGESADKGESMVVSYCQVGGNLRIEGWCITTGENTMYFHRMKLARMKIIIFTAQSS